MNERRIRDHFARQAAGCERLGSPFTARLCRILPDLLDETTLTGRRILGWAGNPGDDAVALRLCSGLHALVLEHADGQLEAVYPPHAAADGSLREAVAAAILRHDGRLAAWLASPPQTNEVARSAMLLPGFIAIGRETGLPLAIREIGASAGLNLHFDRYRYRYGDSCWGRDDSPVRLEPECIGSEPPLGGFLDIASRKGADIAPVDIADPQSLLRLRSYVWADQAARLGRLDAALEIAARDPVAPEKADAAGFIGRELAARKAGETFVLFHSVMWQYMPQAARHGIRNMLEEAGNAGGTAPLAWLRMEPVTASDTFTTLRLTLWPDGSTCDLARCDFHGRWIEWIGG